MGAGGDVGSAAPAAGPPRGPTPFWAGRVEPGGAVLTITIPCPGNHHPPFSVADWKMDACGLCGECEVGQACHVRQLRRQQRREEVKEQVNVAKTDAEVAELQEANEALRLAVQHEEVRFARRIAFAEERGLHVPPVDDLNAAAAAAVAAERAAEAAAEAAAAPEA